MDKKAQAKAIISIIGAIIAIVAVMGLLIFLTGKFSENIESAKAEGSAPITDVVQSDSSFVNSILKISGYVFGEIPNNLPDQTGDIGALIVIIGIWALIFLTFADILRTFSSFSEPISWIIGFIFAVIVANLKATVQITIVFTTLFLSLGLAGLFLGLGMAFVVFVIINFGITSLGPWIMGRKAMIEASKAEVKTKAGAKKVAGAIAGMKTVGEELGR